MGLRSDRLGILEDLVGVFFSLMMEIDESLRFRMAV